MDTLIRSLKAKSAPLWLLASIFVVLNSAHGQEVTARQGNIYVMDKSGREHQITNTGKDGEPALSIDRRLVVYVRLIGTRNNDEKVGATPTTDVSQLWITDVTGQQDPVLLIKAPFELNGRRFWAIHTPEFSADNRYVYFLIDFGATSSAIARVNIKEKTLGIVATGVIRYSEIAGGKYNGYLIAQEHRAKLAPGYFDWYWLLDTTGKEIGIIGQDENDVGLFVEMYRGTEKTNN